MADEISDQACLDALETAASILGESPSRTQYDRLDLCPSATTIMRRFGGWNAAKERAGLPTAIARGRTPLAPPPDDVDPEIREQWADLTVDQRWHYRNREKNATRSLERRARHRAYAAERKADSGCACCSEADPVCLDFHHTDSSQKTRSISELITYGVSKERLEAEIELCRVLCANCHAREHVSPAPLTDWTAATGDSLPLDTTVHTADLSRLDGSGLTKLDRLRAWSHAYKHSRGCRQCAERDAVCLQFHHVSDVKHMSVSELISASYPERDVLAEAERCVVLCANCHRKTHG